MSLISIIESQRNEIQQREQAQREAAKIADKFAVAVLSFEERLVAGTPSFLFSSPTDTTRSKTW